MASWESLSAVGGQVVVSGWSVDPDQVSVSGAVHVYVDGVGVAVTADGERGDVAARFPGGGSRHGFSYTARVAPGVHSVCVYAIDVDPAARHAALGCRSITTQLASPVASWESLSAVGGQVVVSGWSVDPDQVSVSGAVHVYVDGVGVAVTADGERGDVAARFPGGGSRHGFSYTARVAPGVHSVCVYAIDVDPAAGHAALGCRSITTA
ncbi:C2 domain-containing protein [Klenkia terrae]|uniref:hypothetical protein n=1 Tax=Klenkia terrae TaxID=1052259 RepID=UPI001CD89A08|nr:hypothetical protein [Klenkia terrae]